MHFRSTTAGALVVLNPDEANLIDLVIRLHDAVYRRDPTRAISDEERGDMITVALLHNAEKESRRAESRPAPRSRGAAWPAAAAPEAAEENGHATA
jgi:hypothetical protein